MKAKTKLLNETIIEQREMDMLGGVVESAEKALDSVNKVINNKEIKDAGERDAIVSDLDKLKKDVETAKGEYRKVNKVTWRQKKGFDKLLEALKKKETEAKDFGELKALENNIILSHKKCADELETVLEHYSGIKDKIDHLKGLSTFPVKLTAAAPYSPYSAPALIGALIKIQANLKNDIYQLKDAYDKQKEVYTEITAIMSKVKEIW